MLEPKELSVVIKTLSQRHSWLVKALEKPDLEPDARQEYTQAVLCLDSAIKKFAKLTQRSAPPKVVATTSVPINPIQTTPAQRSSSAIKPVRKPKQRYESLEPEKAHVLIAEDNPDSAELLLCILEDMKITKVDVVKDGKQALQTLTKGDTIYDIVLCDWDMPFFTGYEVCKQVCSLAKFQDTHFMMVTAASEMSRIKEAIAIGVNDYIVKPVDAEILEKKIRAALAGYIPPETVEANQSAN